jgi:hypothetical protein
VEVTGEYRGGGPLPTLARMSPTKAFLAALAVALVGLFLPGWFGAVLLLAVVVGMGGLLARTWQFTPPAARSLRIVILALLVIIATAKVVL